jgi:hypothetical protein
MFVVWEDFRSGNADVYAQHLDAAGNPVWAPNGVVVVTQTGGQESPVLTKDGSGGLIVAWQDSRSGGYDIYAQALNSAGATRWTSGGIPICTASGNQVLQVAADDAAGGAYIAWRDLRGLDSDIYVQRVNNAGTTLFSANGNAVCDTTGLQSDVRILGDQQGGAFLVWRDRRTAATGSDFYAQRVSPSGSMLWTKNGVPVVTANSDQLGAVMVSDGRYGFITAWFDLRSGVQYDIYAQRVRQDGSRVWTTNGAALCTDGSSQQIPVIGSDGLAGAIVAWVDSRSFLTTGIDVYAQRVDSLGVPKWTPNGAAICTNDSSQQVQTIVSDKTGGAVLGWEDGRAGFRQIYAQHVNSAGTKLWAAGGLLIATAAGQRNLQSGSEDGYGGCIFAWEDFRNGPNTDIYAYRVTSNGTGVEQSTAPAAPVRLYPARPNPFNPHTVISFRLDQAGPVRLALYDVQGRMVRELFRGNRPAGLSDVPWDGTDARGVACASGVYFALLQAGPTRQQTSITLLR